MTFIWSRRKLYFLLVLAALFYALVWPRFYVGHFGDDARDILAAWSLCQGAYRDLQWPGHPPLGFPLPGFPLLLAPFAALFFSRPFFFHVVPWMSLLAAIFLFDRVLQNEKAPRGWIVVLFALNPASVVTAGRVAADPSYVAMIFGTALLAQRLQTQNSWRLKAALFFLLAWIALLRPEGILWSVALAAAFLIKPARRAAGAMSLAAGILPLLFFCARNSLLHFPSTGYGVLWELTQPVRGAGFFPFVANACYTIWTFVYPIFFGVLPKNSAWTGLGIVLLLILGVRGWLRVFRRSTERRLFIAFSLYVFFYSAMHGAWLAVDPHYLWPLLPFALWWSLEGLSGFAGDRWCRRIFAATLLCFYFLRYADAWADTKSPPVGYRLPQATLQWVRAQTPADSFFLAPQAATVTLYAQRFAIAFTPAVDPDAFYQNLLNTRLTHIWCAESHFLFVQTADAANPMIAWKHIRRWLPLDRDRYERVYQNTDEGATLYKLRRDEKFPPAYRLFLDAQQALARKQWDRGFVLLDDSLRIEKLLAALNAYGAASAASGRNRERGAAYLREAVARRPDFVPAWISLAQLAMQNGRLQESLRDFETASRLGEEERRNDARE